MEKGLPTSMLLCVTSRSCRGITFHLLSSLRFAWNVSWVPAFPKTYMNASGYEAGFSVGCPSRGRMWYASWCRTWKRKREAGSETHPVDP